MIYSYLFIDYFKKSLGLEAKLNMYTHLKTLLNTFCTRIVSDIVTVMKVSKSMDGRLWQPSKRVLKTVWYVITLFPLHLNANVFSNLSGSIPLTESFLSIPLDLICLFFVLPQHIHILAWGKQSVCVLRQNTICTSNKPVENRRERLRR